MQKKATLALEDGSVFTGESFGSNGGFFGELIFHTSATGYQEILTDPSYSGQAIVFTTPHIGNVGANRQDNESLKICCEGIITRSFSNHYSNWRAEGDLQKLLISQGKFCISGIDTRALTHILREKGSLNFYVKTGDLDPELAVLRAQQFLGIKDLTLTDLVTTETVYALPAENKKEFHVVVVDFGVKKSILSMLQKSGCALTIVPAQSSLEKILSLSPDGVVLSNGPGNPESCNEAIKVTKTLIKAKIPLLGICLGHQIIAIASGAKTVKMDFGHHGSNHPIIDIETNSVYISSQNHCYVVSEKTLPKFLMVTHKSLFDGTIAGLKGLNHPILSFQGHPEASPGPQEFNFLFKTFVQLMRRVYVKTN